jgi:hypothetical protein
MVLALSGGHEAGLALVGAAFIIFSLVSSFVLPARNPNFPGRALRWYLPLCVAFFAAMMAAVIVFGREQKAAAEGASQAGQTSTAAGTTTAPAGGGATGRLTSGPYANGDPTAGESVFKSAGCTACHTLKAAGATGKVGPDLDQLPADAQHANMGVEQFAVAAITKPPPPYVPPGYPTNVMPTTFAKTLSTKQIGDLVAFLYKSTASG